MADEERPIERQLWANIEFIKNNTDLQYVIDLLEARRDFLRLKRRQEMEIRRIYLRAAREVGKTLERLPSTVGPLTRSHLTQLERALSREAELIRESLERVTREAIVEGVRLGARAIDNQLVRAIREAQAPLDIVKLQRGFAEVNTSAVEALWARTHNGLRVSDRIWKTSQNARRAMRNLIEVGVATGRDAVAIARDLERYVRSGALTLAKEYPNMMLRMDKRIPRDLSYEALRLIRTERSKAYTEGTYSRGRVNPSYRGAKWMLSAAHPMPDICDILATQDLYGMGPGVYPRGQEPVIPHPNCLCAAVPVLMDTEDFVADLIAWKNDPQSRPYLQEWYNEVYLPLAA